MAVWAVYLAGLCDYPKAGTGRDGNRSLDRTRQEAGQGPARLCRGTLESTPLMKQLILSRTAEELTLTTGITLAVRGGNFRRVRGMTCVAVLADECAFWMSDDSANPDVEILNAVRPALATIQGPLIAISSPYARRGALVGDV